jgi:DNA-binding MarR family transcriptional regulator
VKRADQRLSGELRQRLIVELQGGSHVSQRALAQQLGVAVGTVNRLLNDMIAAGYVRVSNRGVRPFAYRVTDHGRSYQRRLGLEHYSWALGTLRRLEQRTRATLSGLKSRGLKRVVLYGAGEVMDATWRVASRVGLRVIGAVDDDVAQQGRRRGGLIVTAPNAINRLEPDAVLITTPRHAAEIQRAIAPALRSRVEVWEL